MAPAGERSRLEHVIAREHMEGFWELYDPSKYLDRLLRHYLLLGQAKFPKKPKIKHRKSASEVRALLTSMRSIV